MSSQPPVRRHTGGDGHHIDNNKKALQPYSFGYTISLALGPRALYSQGSVFIINNKHRTNMSSTLQGVPIGYETQSQEHFVSIGFGLAYQLASTPSNGSRLAGWPWKIRMRQFPYPWAVDSYVATAHG